MKDLLQDQIALLIAKDQIRDVLFRYSRGVDRGDRDLLKSAYHEDAFDEHAHFYSGNAHLFCDMIIDKGDAFPVLQHYICNSMIDVDGDSAYAESYSFAFQRLLHNDQPFDCFYGTRLLDRFERRRGEGKILHRRGVLDWNRDEELRETWGRGIFGNHPTPEHMGRRDQGDPSYRRPQDRGRPADR